MFIDIKFIRSKNIRTHRLPRAILVYNVDGTPNEAGHITKVVDLIVQYKDNSEWATFHVTGIGRITIPRYGNQPNYDYPRAHVAHGT